MANAHAGIADRYLKMKISVDALMLVFAVTQVSTYIFLKYSKSKVSCWYKKLIIRIAKRINKKSYIKWCASWALSSLVFTPYVMGLCTEFLPQFGIRIVHKKVGSLTNILYLYR